MSALDASIRTHRRQLELSRRFLAGLVALRGCLRADAERLRRRAGGPGAAADERAERLARSIAEVEAQILRARAAVNEELEALARHELAAARRARGERAARRMARR
ncbi:MAG TPA: hypothetical protein VGR91_06960 [Stellaceae bacterium]|nr:hypothetical protein [Stellaceae bacterium]